MYIILLVSILAVSTSHASKHLVEVTEETWKDILHGEWMVEFYAPWCPACKDLSKAWASFADWSKDLEIKVAAIDVTANPGLSGRFLVTALPTIYHVKDSVFRQYTGSRDKDDFISFIEDKKWTIVDPVSSWKHPDTFQMTVVAKFFQMSMAVRDAHTFLVEKKGIPAWGSYLVFGSATLVLGCILGFFIVCLIDLVFPTGGPAGPVKGSAKPPQSNARSTKQSQPEPTKSAKKPVEQNGKESKAQEATKEQKSAAEAESTQSSQSQSEASEDEEQEATGEIRQRKKEAKSEIPTKIPNGSSKQQQSPSKKKS